jgi:pimeloyl-ACP methyl ester carboxylesterase
MGRKDYTIPAFADDVERVIVSLDLKKVVLVGHSMGGSVIIETALRMPEHVTKLVAVDSFETTFQWLRKIKLPKSLPHLKPIFIKRPIRWLTACLRHRQPRQLFNMSLMIWLQCINKYL